MKIAPRAQLLLLFALFALPIAASLVVYNFFPPEGGRSYGELIAPRPATVHAFARPDGPPLRFAELRGRWLLVASDSGACPAACGEKLATMRQVREAMGRNASRVQRVFIVDDLQPLAPGFAEAFAGTEVGFTPRGLVLPGGEANDRAHIYVVDPRGLVMMRFPANADRKRMLHDLNRLLKASQIG